MALIVKALKNKNSAVAINVAFRADGYMNATQLATATGRSYSTWRRSATAQELIDALTLEVELPAASLIVTKRGGSAATVGRGTWIHPDLAVQFAQWCSPMFALQVSRWTRELLTTGQVTMQRQLTGALEAKQASDAIIAEKDAALAEKDAIIADKDAALAEKDAVLDENDAVLAEKDAALAEKDAAIDELTERLNEPRKLEYIYAVTTGNLVSQNLFIVGKTDNPAFMLGVRNHKMKYDDEHYLYHVRSTVDGATIYGMVQQALARYRMPENNGLYKINGARLRHAIDAVFDGEINDDNIEDRDALNAIINDPNYVDNVACPECPVRKERVIKTLLNEMSESVRIPIIKKLIGQFMVYTTHVESFDYDVDAFDEDADTKYCIKWYDFHMFIKHVSDYDFKRLLAIRNTLVDLVDAAPALECIW